MQGRVTCLRLPVPQLLRPPRRENATPALRLDRLLGAVSVPGLVEVVGDPTTVEVVDITNDSASVTAGTMYCCLRGTRADGHDFAGDAVSAGAVALLVERPLPSGS